MAIAKQAVGVTRGYKSRTQRAAKQRPNVLERAGSSFQQSARALLNLARAEIVYATIDTMRLLEYMQYALKRDARTQKREFERDSLNVQTLSVETLKR